MDFVVFCVNPGTDKGLGGRGSLRRVVRVVRQSDRYTTQLNLKERESHRRKKTKKRREK